MYSLSSTVVSRFLPFRMYAVQIRQPNLFGWQCFHLLDSEAFQLRRLVLALISVSIQEVHFDRPTMQHI